MNLKMLLAFISLCLLLISIPSGSNSAELKITDSSDKITIITGAKIDYTKYPSSFGFYKPDFERSGIRAIIGDGVTTIYWRKIKEVKIISIYKANILLTNGDEHKVTLLHESKKGLSGETDLGYFEIQLLSVKRIEVINP